MDETVIKKPQAGPQEQAAACRATCAVVGGSFFGGKALICQANVVTPFGIKQMQDLKIGSQINNPDGSIQQVIGIFPQGKLDVYRVTFDDGSNCEATLDHLWKFRIGASNRFKKFRTIDKIGTEQYRIGTTQNIIDIMARKTKKKHNIYIPITEPVRYTVATNDFKRTYPMPGYTLGVYLGNGCMCKKAISIASMDIQCIDKVSNEWSTYTSSSKKKESKVSQYYFKDENNVIESLGLKGTLCYEKFIPVNYLTAPLELRFELMRGLMDTDGYADDRGHASYSTTSHELALDVQHLARSLGYKASITTKTPTFRYKDEKKTGRLAYTVWINGRSCKDIFYIDRKKSRAKDKIHQGRFIKSIEYSGNKDCMCITVDNPNGLFLTNDFIVTHNSVYLLMEAGRNVDHPKYRGVVFRRTYTQITDAGGLCDIASSLYPQMGAIPTERRTLWTFPTGAQIKFNHLEHDTDIMNYRSSQFCFLGIDQIEEFPESAFYYLRARNRPAPGYDRKCYFRATCNPEPGWLAEFIQWWWDPDTGYPIKDRSGVIRYFIRRDNQIIWVDKDYTETLRGGVVIHPTSFTFIPSTASDNPAGLANDPNYQSNIAAMDAVSVERYMHGNWKVNYSGGMFQERWFKKIKSTDVPKGMQKVRYWDFAASEVKDGKDPDWTAGALCGINGGDFFILDIISFREAPGTTEKKLIEAAEADSKDVGIRWEEEKGSAGKFNSHHLTGKLLGYDAQPDPVSGDKIERAKPLSAAAQAGRVYIVEGPWNAKFLTNAASFPKLKRDEIDACFIAGTMIATPNGNIPINELHIGDEVITPIGIRKIVNFYRRNAHARYYGCFSSTSNHPTYSNGEYKNIDTLTGSSKLSILNSKEMMKWNILNELFLMGEITGYSEGHERITILNSTGICPENIGLLKLFTSQFGNFITKKQYRNAISFIIRIVTHSITTLKILSVYHLKNTIKSILSKILKINVNILREFDRLLNYGINQKQEESGTKNMQKRHFVLYLKLIAYAWYVDRYLGHEKYQSFVQKIAEINIDENIKIRQLKNNVNGVINFLQRDILKANQKDFVRTVAADSMCLGEKEVFNIEVEDAHCYYANEILVGNCDGAMKCLTSEKRVWNSFSISKAKKLDIDWTQTSEYSTLYGAYYLAKNGTLYFLAGIWDGLSGNLFIYHGCKYATLNTQLIAFEGIKTLRMRKPVRMQIVGNDLLCSDPGSRSTIQIIGKEFKKQGVTWNIHSPIAYDFYGSITFAGALFSTDALLVDNRQIEAVAHMAGWHYKEGNKAPAEGYEYGQCLCLMVSELKSVLERERRTYKPQDYAPKEKKQENKESWATA